MAIVFANCGFRFSDYEQMNKLHLRNGKYHFVLQKSQKTKTESIIPVMDKWIIDKYINQYDENFNWNEYEQKFNKYIKLVCKQAGFTEPIQQTYSNPTGGKNFSLHYKKYQKISSRTFRKTFASNCIRQYSMSIAITMSWTGHKSEEAFRKYLRLTPADYARIANEQTEKEKMIQALMNNPQLLNQLKKKVG